MTFAAVTGARGFVGSFVVRGALSRGWRTTAVLRTRNPSDSWPEGVEVRAVGELTNPGAQAAEVRDVDCLIHLAARVHVLSRAGSESVSAFQTMNVDVTRGLAQLGAACGLRRFVFASSSKVFGSSSPAGVELDDYSKTQPDTPYGASKLNAEQALDEVAVRTNLFCVSLRPPAVYGSGVRAFFAMLINSVRTGLPLPLGSVDR